MRSIDEIMEMLDWHNDSEIQKKGRELAKEIKPVDVFFQPVQPKYNKNVWDNCAMILAEKTDSELCPYLHELFEWLMDMNWPGTFCISERLKEYKADECFFNNLDECIIEAGNSDDEVWLNNLREFDTRSNNL